MLSSFTTSGNIIIVQSLIGYQKTYHCESIVTSPSLSSLCLPLHLPLQCCFAHSPYQHVFSSMCANDLGIAAFESHELNWGGSLTFSPEFPSVSLNVLKLANCRSKVHIPAGLPWSYPKGSRSEVATWTAMSPRKREARHTDTSRFFARFWPVHASAAVSNNNVQHTPGSYMLQIISRLHDSWGGENSTSPGWHQRNQDHKKAMFSYLYAARQDLFIAKCLDEQTGCFLGSKQWLSEPGN